MSCLLFWCCRGRQSDSDTETNGNEEQMSRDGGKIKRKKRCRLSKRKGQQEKEMTVDIERAEEIQTTPQTAAGEEGSAVPHLPAGIVSGSLEKISAGTPEKMETPLHEDFQTTKDIPEASNDLSGNLPDQVKAEFVAEAIKPLMSADLNEEVDNNQPLEKMENQMMSTKAEVTEELMEALLQEVVAHSAALKSEKLKKTAAEAEAEVIQELMNIYLDETEETVENHLGDEVIATEVEADVEEKSDAESDWMFDYVPIKSWADFMEETEGTIDQSDEIEELKNDFPVNEVKPDKQERNTSKKSKADEEENSTRTSGYRGIQVGTVDQWRHQQEFDKTRTLSENSGTCDRAPETDPQQKRRAQRKEDRRESCHWTVKHLLKTLQAPAEEKSAPQRDCRRNGEQTYGKTRTQPENSKTCERAPVTDPHQQRRTQRKEDRRETRCWTVNHLHKTLQEPPEKKSAPLRDNRECLRGRTAEIRQKSHPRPANKPRDRGCRMGEHGRRGAAQCWQSESSFQRRDAPQTPSNNGGRVSERGIRGNPTQCTPAHTERSEPTLRKPNWWQHDDRSAEPYERETRERHQKKKWSNGNRQWKSGRRPDASY